MKVKDLQTDNWYVLRTVPGKEQEAAELIERTVDRRLWKQCRILKKQKLFRVEGKYFLSREAMFPGYMFIETEKPVRLGSAFEISEIDRQRQSFDRPGREERPGVSESCLRGRPAERNVSFKSGS